MAGSHSVWSNSASGAYTWEGSGTSNADGRGTMLGSLFAINSGAAATPTTAWRLLSIRFYCTSAFAGAGSGYKVHAWTDIDRATPANNQPGGSNAPNYSSSAFTISTAGWYQIDLGTPLNLPSMNNSSTASNTLIFGVAIEAPVTPYNYQVVPQASLGFSTPKYSAEDPSYLMLGDAWTANRTGWFAYTASSTGGWTTYYAGLDVIVDEGSAGSNYTSSPADAVGVTDSITLTRSTIKALSDSVGVTDSLSQTQSKIWTPADAVGVTDLVTVADLLPRSTDDPTGITDSLTVTQDLARPVSDAVDVTDAVAVIKDVARSISDPVGVTDALTAITAFARAATDAVAVTDLVGVLQAFDRPIDESVAVTDSLSVSLTSASGQVMSDPVDVSDALLVTHDYVVVLGDSVGAADTLTTPRLLDVQLTDAVAITDVAALIRAVDVQLGENVNITDSMVRVLTAPGGALVTSPLRYNGSTWVQWETIAL